MSGPRPRRSGAMAQPRLHSARCSSPPRQPLPCRCSTGTSPSVRRGTAHTAARASEVRSCCTKCIAVRCILLPRWPAMSRPVIVLSFVLCFMRARSASFIPPRFVLPCATQAQRGEQSLGRPSPPCTKRATGRTVRAPAHAEYHSALAIWPVVAPRDSAAPAAHAQRQGRTWRGSANMFNTHRKWRTSCPGCPSARSSSAR